MKSTNTGPLFLVCNQNSLAIKIAGARTEDKSRATRTAISMTGVRESRHSAGDSFYWAFESRRCSTISEILSQVF